MQQPVRLQVQVKRTKYELEEILQGKFKIFYLTQIKGNPIILQCKLNILTKIQIDGNPTMEINNIDIIQIERNPAT